MYHSFILVPPSLKIVLLLCSPPKIQKLGSPLIFRKNNVEYAKNNIKYNHENRIFLVRSPHHKHFGKAQYLILLALW